MATDNNIKNFTALDIEKYHKGLLSAKEMHDLEKAALDDPFLADALEGYAVAGVNAESDMADLKKRLSERTEGARVIPLQTERKNNFGLLKVAAMLILVAGGAFLVYQLGFNNNKKEIAQADLIQKEESKNDVTEDNITTAPKEISTDANAPAQATNEPATVKAATIPGSNTNSGLTQEKDLATIKGNDGEVDESKTFTTVVPAPVGKMEEKKLLAKEDVKNKSAVITRQESAAEVSKDNTLDISIADDERKNRSVAASKKVDNQNYLNQAQIFRGRVTDQNNVGVPFANVTNLEENTGTYTDARGYFNLTYPDTVLNVQVRSIGFENNNVQLRNTAPTNQVILQDDRAGLSEVVISNQKPNLMARSNNNTMQLEEPEPADGWTYYDNYLLNNLQPPEEFRSKPVASSGEVQVSFEVNKNGEPVNFKIEKSLCSKCDKEAIRLIKEGPKWRRKAKNGRTTVTIPF